MLSVSHTDPLLHLIPSVSNWQGQSETYKIIHPLKLPWVTEPKYQLNTKQTSDENFKKIRWLSDNISKMN